MPDPLEIVRHMSDAQKRAVRSLADPTQDADPVPTEIIDQLELNGLVDYRPADGVAELTPLGHDVARVLQE